MSRAPVVLLPLLVAACAADVDTIDPRIYFSRETPLGTTMSFSWSVMSLQWEHVSDCVRDPGPVGKAVCQQLARYEVATDRRRATVSAESDGQGIVLSAPFKAEANPGNGRDVFTVYLVPERKIEGVELWLIDLARTAEANLPVPAASEMSSRATAPGYSAEAVGFRSERLRTFMFSSSTTSEKAMAK